MNNAKALLLNNLQNTFCRLMPSRISGVGVFAIRDIAKGFNPFILITDEKWLKFNIDELKGLDEEVLKMVDNFFVVEENGLVWIPKFGLNGMNLSFFMNNSADANMYSPDDGPTFVALRDIKKGEELTLSYANYDWKYKQ